MIKIHIKNAFSTIKGLDESSLNIVLPALTYKDEEIAKEIKNLSIRIQMELRSSRPNSYRVKAFKKRISEIKNKEIVCLLRTDDSFPTGLLFLVKEVLDSKSIPYTLVDEREKPRKYINYKSYSDLELRYYQKEAIGLALKAGRGVLEMSIGSGKTLVAQEIVRALGLRALVIAPAKDLKQQLMDSFADQFGQSQVCDVTTTAVKTKKKLKNIRFVTVQTLASLRKSNLLDRLTSDVDILITDEVHHSGAQTYLDLLPHFEHVYHKYGFSGTYTRGDSKLLPLLGFNADVVYRYSPAQAIKDGYLTPMKVLIHEVSGKASKNYQTEYKKNYCKNTELLLKLQTIFENHIDSNDQVLIMVKQKEEAGKIIHKFLNEIGVENTFISGDDKKDVIKRALEGFNAKTIKVLIGSAIIGEGIDIKSTKHLIMCQGGRSRIAITQNLGRCVRLFPGKTMAYVHDFLFQNTFYMEKHLAERIKIYENTFDAKGNIEILE
jgi:superfamily II DNA or RNA helicase